LSDFVSWRVPDAHKAKECASDLQVSILVDVAKFLFSVCLAQICQFSTIVYYTNAEDSETLLSELLNLSDKALLFIRGESGKAAILLLVSGALVNHTFGGALKKEGVCAWFDKTFNDSRHCLPFTCEVERSNMLILGCE